MATKSGNEITSTPAALLEECSPDKPLISLCMIARDNEKTIGPSLASAKPWVDEIIVVDTGSSDRTAEIAREHGATVEHFEWCDDFAAARNQSLEHANGDWLFWMDTDDTLPAECGQRMREMLTDEIPAEVLGFIMQVRCPRETNLMEDGSFAEPSIDTDPIDCDAVVVDHVKLFRNEKELRFEGRIHEQILPAIRSAGGVVRWTDNFVVHSGADHSAAGMSRKLDRDLRILRLDIKERPEHPFVHFNLGMTLLHRGEHEEARQAIEKCIQLSTTLESHVRKAYALWVDCLEQSNESEAINRCWEGLGRYPNDPELSFKLGRLLMIDRRWDEAIEAFYRVLNQNSERHFSSIDSGIRGHKTFANLAICHTELGQDFEALGAWQGCLEHAPTFVDAWEGIVELSVRLDQIALLAQLADTLKDNAEAVSFVQICRGWVAADDRKLDDAIEYFEEAFLHDAQSSFVLNQYARLLNEHRQWESSIPVLQQLSVLEPTNPSPLHNLGIALYQSEKYADAVVALEDSIKLRPNYQPSMDLLTRCRDQLLLATQNDLALIEE